MAILASDNFNRADENPIASPWVDPGFSGTAQLLSNAFNGTNSDGGVYYDGGVSWPADQYSKMTLKTPNIGESDTAGGPMCRVQTGAASGYIFGVGGGFATIKKFTAGSLSGALASVSTASVLANSVMEIRAVGTTISGWVDGVQIVSATDSDFATGKPGLYKYPSGTISYDDWEGGDVGGPVTGAVTESATAADSLAGTRTHTKDQPEAVTAAESTAASISSLPPGTFTSGIFARNGGEENSALTALTYVSVCHPTTGLQLSLRTGLSTSGTGQLVFTDPVMVAGTAYLVEWLEVGGHRGWDVQVAT